MTTLPSPDWNGVPVRWRGFLIDGTPVRGFITFVAAVSRFLDDDQDQPQLVLGGPIKVPINDGFAMVNLPATDDPDITPNGFTYTVTEELTNATGTTYTIEAPLASAGTGIELAHVAPVPVSPGTPVSLVTRSEFDALTQTTMLGVDQSVAPTDGQVLKYDEATGTWVPGTGGTEVGAWEQNVTATWTIPPMKEWNYTSSPLPVTPTKPATPQFQWTVGANDWLVTCDNPTVGWETMGYLHFTADLNTGSGGGIVYTEATINGVATSLSVNSVNPASSRANGTYAFRDVQPGDVVTLSVWCLTGYSGVLEWVGATARPGYHFIPPVGSARYLYKNIKVTGTSPSQVPTATLSTKGTLTVQNYNNYWFLDVGGLATSVPSTRDYLVAAQGYGLVQNYLAHYAGGTKGQQSSGFNVHQEQVPLQVTLDRLQIPVPPNTL